MSNKTEWELEEERMRRYKLADDFATNLYGVFSEPIDDTKFDAATKGYLAGYEQGKKDASKWISVKERFPAKEGLFPVLYSQFGHMSLGYFVLNSDTLQMQWQLDRKIAKDITHWCELPQKPKDQE